jgi:hypothetical protein
MRKSNDKKLDKEICPVASTACEPGGPLFFTMTDSVPNVATDVAFDAAGSAPNAACRSCAVALPREPTAAKGSQPAQLVGPASLLH